VSIANNNPSTSARNFIILLLYWNCSAGLTISPLTLRIVSKTSGEFQEKLVKSQLEAKYSLIFLTYLVSIRYGIALIIYNISYWWDYKCSTTSKWDSRKIYKFTKSAWNFILIIISLLILITLNYASIDQIIFINFINMYLILYIYSLFSLIIPLKISNSSLTYRSNSYQYGKKNNHIASSKRYYSTDFSKKDSNNLTIEELKLFHHTIIKDLYKDRNAKVIPFKDKVLATCEDINNKSEFLKEWGSSSCIYLIEYKYDPLIYYIGRTSLFKRRFYNHLQANSNNKFHLFLKLVGWEHFKVSIIEIKPVTELG